MNQCIASNFDIFLTGLVLGIFLNIVSRVFVKWAEIKALNEQLKLNKLLGEAVINMQERLKAQNENNK